LRDVREMREVGEKTRQNQGLILSKVLKKRVKNLRCHSYYTSKVLGADYSPAGQVSVFGVGWK